MTLNSAAGPGMCSWLKLLRKTLPVAQTFTLSHQGDTHYPTLFVKRLKATKMAFSLKLFGVVSNTLMEHYCHFVSLFNG